MGKKRDTKDLLPCCVVLCCVAFAQDECLFAGLGGCGNVKGCNRRLPRLQPSNQVAIQAKLTSRITVQSKKQKRQKHGMNESIESIKKEKEEKRETNKLKTNGWHA